MLKKNIKKHLRDKIQDFLKTIDDEKLKTALRKNIVVTGGSIVSLLLDDKVNDYDIYLKDKKVLYDLVIYYLSKSEDIDYSTTLYKDKSEFVGLEGSTVYLYENEHGGIGVKIQSAGLLNEDDFKIANGNDEDSDIDKSEEKYRVKYLTENAITLTDKIQIVLRFAGNAEEIHKNYDFVHCTNYYDYLNNSLVLNEEALTSILTKELKYQGSKFPICSMIRLRKFLARGWTVNAGQLLKIAYQINNLDMNDIEVLKDQLTGVDSWYFEQLINKLVEAKDKNIDIDYNYVVEIIDEIF